MKRPLGITLIGLFLGWESLAGIVVGLMAVTGEFDSLGPLLGILSVACGALAAMATVRLWKMSETGRFYMRLWMVATLLFVVLFTCSFQDGFMGDAKAGAAIFIALSITLFVYIDYYVRKRLP